MNESLDRAVQRKLEEIKGDPEKLMRYDRNGDGVIDDEEWEEVCRLITLEVQTERRRQQGQSDAEHDDLSPIIGDRFEVMYLLGRGAQGRTFLARDRRSGEKVALKELDLSQADDWKTIELFDREAHALRHLDHPGIPGYVDAFHRSDEEGEERFFLAQEFVEGNDFESLINEGLTFTEEEARSVLEQILQILVYLQDRSPPVIHRDIKPSNLMRRPDGSVALIDFGAVQSVLPGAEGGSTIIGTSGYMPVEQLMGRAKPATDLYALGATAIHLLSHRHPADLPMKQMALEFKPFINTSDRFADYLEQLVEPQLEKRFATASEAAEVLANLDHKSQSRSPTVPGESVEDKDHEIASPSQVVTLLVLIMLLTIGLASFSVTNAGRIDMILRGGEYRDLVMGPVYDCEVAIEVLGEDIRIPILAYQRGQTPATEGLGWSEWTFPVAGDKARGSYSFYASQRRGIWELESAILTVDQESYDLMECD